MRITEFKRCKCGYSILVYIMGRKSALKYIFIDGMSGNYEQVDTCPGCHDQIDYIMLEG
jgi:hypothetical protein